MHEPTPSANMIRSWPSFVRGDQCERAANLICLELCPLPLIKLSLFPVHHALNADATSSPN